MLAIILLVMVFFPGSVMAAEKLSGTLTNSTGVHQVKGRWKKKDGKYYFRTSSVKDKRGWLKLRAGTYYLKKNGCRVSGQVKIDGRYYFFRKNGKQRTGWITVKGKDYYFDPSEGGAAFADRTNAAA